MSAHDEGEALHIEAPQGMLTGFPIRVHVHAKSAPKVDIEDLQSGKTYALTMSQGIHGYDGEMLFDVAGTYKVKYGSEIKMLVLEKNQILDFGTEFGVFSTSVAVLLVLMIFWLKRRDIWKKASAK